MINEELNKRLKMLNIEDKIWIVYIGIIVMSWISNHFERNYFLYNDEISKKKYQAITVLIFSILIIVYLFFLKDSINDLKNLKPTDTPKKRKFVYLSFIGSLLIAISGFIFLYIALTDEELNIEIAFN